MTQARVPARFLVGGKDDPRLSREETEMFELTLLVIVETLKALGISEGRMKVAAVRGVAFRSVLDAQGEKGRGPRSLEFRHEPNQAEGQPT
jgi:hypothetical protein